MKIKSLVLSFAAALALAGSVSAQQTTETPPNIFQQIGGYFTSLDPASRTWTDSTSAWIGADYVAGLNVAQTFGLSHDLWTSSKLADSAASTNMLGGTALSLESTTRNAGIAGTILSSGIGIGYSLIKADVKATAFVEGNYDFSAKEIGVEVGARVQKAIGAHAFAGMQISIMSQRPGTPTVGIFTGITF